MTVSTLNKQRAVAALKSLFIGDALAMPVHWYYNPLDIERQFPGGVSKFEDAPKKHPSSIMSLHSTSQGGRGSHGSQGRQREIVGDVILKGKRQYWDQANQHYHRSMRAGENTLNAHCVRALFRSLAEGQGHYSKDLFLDAYIELLTADSPLHPDTYAESYHRGFFANLEQGKARDRCGAVTHDTASIGGLVTIAPIVLSERLRGTSLQVVQDRCREHLWLTHPDESLARICSDYVALLDKLLFRDDQAGDDDGVAEILSVAARNSIGLDLEALRRRAHSDHDVIGKKFSPACYISGSWPGVLYLAYKYRDSVKKALIANTNLGGDNVHRGSVLAVLVSLATAATDDELFLQLVDCQAIEREIDEILNVPVLTE